MTGYEGTIRPGRGAGFPTPGALDAARNTAALAWLGEALTDAPSVPVEAESRPVDQVHAEARGDATDATVTP